MHASDQELENLKRLQHIDAEVIRNKKKLDELPQRQTILETRQKLSAIIKKKTQVQDMIDAFEDELHALLSEDERLEKKQQETQEALDRVKGDYRSACRSAFDSTRISRIKQDAPVSRCPSCRRLLIVTA